MKWIWPFSWYFRIRQLEAELERERGISREAHRRLMAMQMAHSVEMITFANACYASMQSVLDTVRS